MALLDLSSDLSKFRSQVSGQEKNNPESSKATNNKNFATFQPITEKLSSFSARTINKPEKIKKLESKLPSTKLDDIQKFAQENLLINSVSKYSGANLKYNEKSISKISTKQVVSRFNKIQQKEFVSSLNKSNVVVIQPSGEKNNRSPIDVVVQPIGENNNQSPVDIVANKEDASNNIQNPNITIVRPPLTMDRKSSSPNITVNKEDDSDNIESPNIVINKIPLTFDRSESSPKIYINKNESTNNIQNPNIDILRKALSFDRKNQTPNIITETIKEGLVVNPNTNVIRMEHGTFHLDDESKLNPSGKTIRFVTESRLVNKDVTPKKDTQRYDGISEQLKDNSELNLDAVVKTIPFGRNEDPSKSKFSVVGVQQVNFFKDDYAKGFVVNAQKGESQYKESSSFTWKGKTPPSVNFITDINAKGFQTRTPLNQTAYNTESSKFGFKVSPEVDFFDAIKKYTSEGFKKFATILRSVYQPDASQFGWAGKREAAPEANYFDTENKNTNAGFHKFAKIYDTKYITDSSNYDWDGKREAAPEANYFDITGKNTTAGFHKFAQKYDTKYVPESSGFDWDGKRESAPEVNYFDITGKNTTAGFHRFAQIYDTKYVPESSIFDWDGTRLDAPEVDYFDITKKNTTAGFHRFALIYDTKYVPESSIFDWDGKRSDAPHVDYFDITKRNTTVGFHTFAQIYDTKYVPESSIFDWDGKRPDAPHVDYFDITKRNTTVGFHTFAQIYDTKYVPESSIFDWDGKRPDAPHVDYFDITKRNTTVGFHTFAQIYDTKYVPESSIFDWDGKRPDAPHVDYFDITKRNTTVGFHTFAQIYDTKYVPESSIFDWDGKRPDAPHVDYFDISKKNTTAGFHTFARIYDTKYVPESSIFDWDGKRTDAPAVDYFDISKKNTTVGFHTFAQIYDTKYVKESSGFDWDGNRSAAPEVNYFDIAKKYTKAGFHRLAELYDSKYVKEASRFDWDGNSKAAPKTDFFANDNATGFTTFAQKLETEYKKDSSEFTFKGGLPKPVDFFQNEAASGFINKTAILESKYNKDISKFTFKGTVPTPVDFFPNGEAEGFSIKSEPLQSKYVKDVSKFTFKGQVPKPVDFFQNTQADGFVIKTPKLESKYKEDISSFVFKGKKTSAPSVDYIDNNFATGFTNFAGSLFTEYRPKKSKFTWLGSRSDAPSVNYFKIPNQNPDAIEGFTTLFVDKTQTKYSDKLSFFSIESSNKKSPVKNVPYTTFFGYRPSERTGFMVGMTTFDGTLYPIIDPILKFDATDSQRVTISTIRGENPAALKTTQLDTYAPLSLGKRPWANGTLFSTLESQIENPKTHAPGGSYLKKYERTMQDATNKLGYLTKWSITRRSPSPLDDQYSKYKLQDEAVNHEIAAFNQPYVVRGIQRKGEVDNQRWGFGVKFDDGIVRGGIVTQAERILQDVFRLGKWTLSIKGLMFNIKQLGLQAMNPAVDVDPNTPTSGVFGVSSTLLFNPLTLLANVATARAGVHLSRHGINPFDSDYLNKYEKATRNRELKQRFTDEKYQSFDNLTAPNPALGDPPPGYNRLIGLMKEMLPMSFTPLINAPSTTTDASSLASKAKQAILKKIFGEGRIARISSKFGGAQSYFGIGGTDIHKSSHPYLTFYTTQPNLYDSGKEPQYLDSAKRESFFGAISETTYSDRLKKEKSDFVSKDFYGIIKALTQIVDDAPDDPVSSRNPDNLPDTIPVQQDTKDRIQQLNPFNPKHDTTFNRIQAITSRNAEKNASALHLGPSNLINDYDTNPIKKYRTLAYGKLNKPPRHNKPAGRSVNFNDFRHDLELSGSESFITNPKVARYESRNLEDYFGLGRHGKPGAQRNLPFVSNINYKSTDKEIDKKTTGQAAKAGTKEFYEAQKFMAYSIPQLKESGSAGQSKYEFRGDRINIIDYKRANFKLNSDFVYERGSYGDPTLPGTHDLVDFYFTSLVLAGHNYCPAEVIVFRAIFDNISDNHKPSWNSIKYMGRGDPLYVYQGYERSISFGFTIHIGSRDEMKATWRKLNYLASWTAPEYTLHGLIRGPMCRLNIGNLYRKMPGYLGSLTYTFDNGNGYWETAKLYEDQRLDGPNKEASIPGVLQLPKTIQVSCEFVPIGVYRPEKNGIMYSLYDDTAAGVENGLLPAGKNKVNYFRTFDSLPMSDAANSVYTPVPPNTETEVLTDEEINKSFAPDTTAAATAATQAQPNQDPAGGNGNNSGGSSNTPDSIANQVDALDNLSPNIG